MDKIWDSEKKAWVDLPDEPIVIDDDKKRGREEADEEQEQDERKKAKTSPTDAQGPPAPSSPSVDPPPAASSPPTPYSSTQATPEFSSFSSEILRNSLAQPVYNMPRDVLRALVKLSADPAAASETEYAVRHLYARLASVGEIGKLLRDEATLPINKAGDRLTLGEVLVRAGAPQALPDEGGRDVMWWKRKILHAIKILRTRVRVESALDVAQLRELRATGGVESVSIAATIKFDVTRDDISSIIDCWHFMEGDSEEIKTRSYVPSREAFCACEEGAHIKIVFNLPEDGGNIINEGEKLVRELTLPMLMGGIRKFVEKRGTWSPEDYDAMDYGIIVQLALFGEIRIS